MTRPVDLALCQKHLPPITQFHGATTTPGSPFERSHGTVHVDAIATLIAFHDLFELDLLSVGEGETCAAGESGGVESADLLPVWVDSGKGFVGYGEEGGILALGCGCSYDLCGVGRMEDQARRLVRSTMSAVK